MAPVLTVCIPYLENRAALLSAVVTRFHETLEPGTFEILTTTGGTWGAGCNQLAAQASGDYLLFGCDDTAPYDGWFEAGRPVVDAGKVPASRYFHASGEPLHEKDMLPGGVPIEWTRSYLLRRETFKAVGPMIDTTWWADINYSERLVAAGFPIVTCDGFSFAHLNSERDWLTPEIENHERETYERARNEAHPSAIFW